MTTVSPRKARPLRLLVAISSYGEKHLPFLRKLIQNYRKMTMDVDVVVLSDAPKNLGPDVKVVVGLPSRNRWSLPFAHKRIFAECVDRYDIFAYAEDDMEVTERNMKAFLSVAPALQSDEICGFLRYEIDPNGKSVLPEVHGMFRWKPESVKRRGSYCIAEFTNEHAGFYLLTQAQLKQALASGGFLRTPYMGRYGMPESAATDPYTSCGFRKVICISMLEDFLLHHMSNRYAGRLGVPLTSFKEQVQTLLRIEQGEHPATTLCPVEAKMPGGWCSKSFYEEPNEALLELVPQEAKTVLSIGCGWGAAEARLLQRGVKVTALPLDSVIGAVAARQGIDVLYGTLEEGLRNLESKEFDAVMVTNLLHLLSAPSRVLEHCARMLRPTGSLVMAGPNFGYLPVLVRRALRLEEHEKLGSFALSGVNAFNLTQLRDWLQSAALMVDETVWQKPKRTGRLSGSLMAGLRPGRVAAETWVVRARR